MLITCVLLSLVPRQFRTVFVKKKRQADENCNKTIDE